MNKLQQLRREIVEKHEKQLAYLDKNAAVLGPILEAAEKLDPTSLYIEDGYTNIAITGDRHKLNAAFGLLRRNGYQTTARPEKGQSTYSGFFHAEDGKPDGGMVYLSFSSTQCRRVKVGTRTREVIEDVYETVCDEQEFPERANEGAEYPPRTPMVATAQEEEIPF